LVQVEPEALVVAVTGTRAALAKPLELKRNSDLIEDSISVTELGHFHNDNVADSLTHISSTSVSRTRGGEGPYANVRGLGAGDHVAARSAETIRRKLNQQRRRPPSVRQDHTARRNCLLDSEYPD